MARGVRARRAARARAARRALRDRVPARRARTRSTRVEKDDLYLVGTSEVPLAGMHADEILDAEAAAAALRGVLDLLPARGRDLRQGHARHPARAPVRQGRDVRATRPPRRPGTSTSACATLQVRILSGLGLHGRVVDIAVGDLGASAARKYDIEVWLPGQQAYRELTSASNCTDYQARRLRTRYRTGRRRDRAGAHAQRHRGRGGPHADRAAGERPAGGRLGGRAGGAGGYLGKERLGP